MNNILIQGKGVISKIAVDSVNGVEAFKGKTNKKAFIDVLQEGANMNLVLIAYCVLDGTAHFIVKGNTKADVEAYIKTVYSQYATVYKGASANPLRGDYLLQKVSSNDLGKAVSYVHSLAPTLAVDYPYCSYSYLREGTCGGVAVIIAENGGNMTEEDFVTWLDMQAGKGYKTFKSGKEKFGKVLKEDKLRYLAGGAKEESVVYVIADLCERCGAKYKKAARALGFSYHARKGSRCIWRYQNDRRDIMISVLLELIRRGRSFSEAIAIMKIFTENRTGLLLDCIVEENRVHSYSYDHIIHSFGIDDYYYDILAEIMCGLHRKYRYSFEELCVKYHLQNDILALRAKCQF